MLGNGNKCRADFIKFILVIAILASLSYSMAHSIKAAEYSILHWSHNICEKNARDTKNRSSMDTGPVEKQIVKIRLIDMPMDTNGDNVPDIGYIRGWEETGYRFNILLERIDPYSHERAPLPNCNVSLQITFRDVKGGRYINSTTRKTNWLGRADFNFTGFYSDEGIKIGQSGLGASGTAVIEYAGTSRYHCATKEVFLNYMARPAPPNIYRVPTEDSGPSTTCCILFLLIPATVFASIFFRNREQEKRNIVEKMYDIIRRQTNRTNPDLTLFRLVEGLTMAKQINHRTYEARYLRQMGLVYREKEEPDMAITYIQHAMEIERSLNLEDQEIFDLIRISRLCLELGNVEKAVEFQKKTEVVYRNWFST